jgi:copper chaperone CopZ
MTTVTYHIPAISCQHCVHTIKTELGDLQGIASVEGDVESKQVKVTYDAPASEESIKKLLAEINYPAES